MNIFYTDPEPRVMAMHLDDKRLNKMIVESAQILSTVARLALPQEQCDFLKVYKATHIHHPCVKWAAATAANFHLLENILTSYILEYKYRFDKLHGCRQVHLAVNAAGMALWPDIPSYLMGFASEPPKCFHPLVPRNLPITVGYKQTLRLKWLNDLRQPTWTKREKPIFADTV
jgi:hypothetical protein